MDHYECNLVIKDNLDSILRIHVETFKFSTLLSFLSDVNESNDVCNVDITYYAKGVDPFVL